MNEEQKQLRRDFAKKQWDEIRRNPQSYLEICKKMSNADKGRHPVKEFKKGNIPWNKGKSLSDIHKKNLSKSLLGRESWNKGLTKEIDERITQPWLGKKRPEMKNIKGWNRTGFEAWNKDKECPQLSKENHWNWQGGRSLEDNYSFYFKNVISKRLRKEFPCLVCGTKKDLVVHHCDLDKKNNKISNLLVLCRPHHSQMHHIIMEVYNG